VGKMQGKEDEAKEKKMVMPSSDWMYILNRDAPIRHWLNNRPITD